MGQPIQSEDLIALAQAQLAAQFADAPNLQRVVASIATSVQEIDIVTVQLASWDDLDTAVGVALDQMGEMYRSHHWQFPSRSCPSASKERASPSSATPTAYLGALPATGRVMGTPGSRRA